MSFISCDFSRIHTIPCILVLELARDAESKALSCLGCLGGGGSNGFASFVCSTANLLSGFLAEAIESLASFICSTIQLLAGFLAEVIKSFPGLLKEIHVQGGWMGAMRLRVE